MLFWAHITTIISFLKVYTAQNVELDFPIANLGQRIGAALIDFVILMLYAVSASYFIASLGGGDRLVITVIVALLIPYLLYYPLVEYFLNGQTFGKLLLKLRVVRVDGSSASLSDLLLRWLLRVIDVNVGFILLIILGTFQIEQQFYSFLIILFILPIPLVGMVSIMRTKLGQRIGDLAANTVVIYTKRQHHLEETILLKNESEYEPRYPQVLELRDKDIYTIKSVVDFAKKKENYLDAHRLANKASQRLGIELGTDMNNEQAMDFLETLLKDYNHLAVERDQDLFL